jgi:hypothetical protein
MSQPTGQTHIDQLAAEIAALQAQLLKEVAAVDRVEGWRYDGAASLIPEYGWHITGDPNHDVTWIRPDSTPFDPGRTHLQQIVLSTSTSRLLLAEP